MNVRFGLETGIWIYAFFAIIVLTLLAWVEDIKKFSMTFLFGNLLILSTVIAVSIYCCQQLYEDGHGPDIVPYNPMGFWATVGFAIYSYEGIGIVMPILAKAREPEKFNKSLVAAIATLCLLYVGFGELTSWTYGSNLTEPFITEMLPAKSVIVCVIKVLFVGNLICSYPITIKPTNDIIESYLFPRRGGNSP